MIRLPQPVLLLGLLALGACRAVRPAPPPPPSAASVRSPVFDLAGVVRDEGTGRPLAGVLVVADALPGHRAITDPAGAYRISGLPRGWYAVSARKVGYYVERREVASDCPVVIVDGAGRPIGGGGPCDPAPQVLNFLLRVHTVY